MAANRHGFTVTWPEGAERPMGCPRSYRVWFPTLAAMDLAAEAYRMAGAAVSSGPPVTDCSYHRMYPSAGTGHHSCTCRAQ